MIEVYLLEQLISFAQNGTLSKAAKELHISQPALSKSMQKIEEEIGVPIFNRSNRHIELNDTGEVAVKYAKIAVKANQMITTQAKQYDESKHILSIGACASIVLDPALKIIEKYCPKLQLKTQVNDDQILINRLLNHQLDLIILHHKESEPSLVYKHYLNERLMLTVNHEDTLAKLTNLRFKDLAGMSILAHQTANFWIHICQNNILNVNLLIQEKISSMKQLFEATHLPIFNSSLALKLHKNSEDQVTLPIMDSAALVNYYLVCRTEDYPQLKKTIQRIQNENYFNS